MSTSFSVRISKTGQNNLRDIPTSSASFSAQILNQPTWPFDQLKSRRVEKSTSQKVDVSKSRRVKKSTSQKVDESKSRWVKKSMSQKVDESKSRRVRHRPGTIATSKNELKRLSLIVAETKFGQREIFFCSVFQIGLRFVASLFVRPTGNVD